MSVEEQKKSSKQRYRISHSVTIIIEKYLWHTSCNRQLCEKNKMETDIVLRWFIYFVEANLDFETRLLATRYGVSSMRYCRCININCDIYFNDRVYSYLATCYWVIHGSRDQTYSEFWPRMCTYEHFHVT